MEGLASTTYALAVTVLAATVVVIPASVIVTVTVTAFGLTGTIVMPGITLEARVGWTVPSELGRPRDPSGP